MICGLVTHHPNCMCEDCYQEWLRCNRDDDIRASEPETMTIEEFVELYGDDEQ
jgi:hypothetical protein